MKNLSLHQIMTEACRITKPDILDSILRSPEHSIDFTYNILQEAGLLPQVEVVNGKSDELSKKYRLRGNDAFVTSKNDMEAFQLYTKAICSATIDSDEIYLAYGNRSAVTFALREYQESIMDINRCLEGNYPSQMKYKLFERRGKCLQALSRFQPASADFKTAKNLIENNQLSTDKKKALSARMDILIEECLNSVDVQPCVDDIRNFELSYGRSNSIQCGSSAIAVKYSAKMGRHIVASRELLPGDVLAIEKPYAAVLLPDSYSLFCDYCKKRCHSSVPCVYCCDVLFCDTTCRQKSWSSYHCIECALLPSLLSVGCNKMELLAIRMLLIVSKCGAIGQLCDYPPDSLSSDFKDLVDGKHLLNDYRNTHYLETNVVLRSQEYMFQRCVIASVIVHLLKEATLFFKESIMWENVSQLLKDTRYSDLFPIEAEAGRYILRYLMIASSNAHEITEMRVRIIGGELIPESTEIGGAIYPLLSLINHSCDPNVVRHSFNGDSVVLTCIQTIKEGEQIFDNYGYHHAIHSLDNRQESLKAQYYFSCECVACVNDWPKYESLPDGPPNFLSFGQEESIKTSSKAFARVLSDVKSGKTSNDDLSFLFEHLALLHETVQRPWKEYNQCQEAIKLCLSLKANHYVYK